MPRDKNKMGLWMSTALVIGNMIGAGVFLMPATLAVYGGIGLLGWIFSAIGAIFIAKVFSKLSVLVPGANGGPYVYTRQGFGDFAGFLIAWGYWISAWTANAAIAVSLISALSDFFPVLASNPFAAILTGLSAIWMLTWLNTKGIIASGKMQIITTALKIIPLLIVGIGGLFFIHVQNFVPFNISSSNNFTAITAAGALTMYAFTGLECGTVPAASVEKPEKIIPRATMLGTIVVMIIYVLGSFSVMGIVAAKDLQNSVTPFADAGKVIFGQSAHYWISAGVAIASFGCLNGWILIQGQVPYAIAKDKLFPSVFGKENKYGAPAAAIIISSILVSLLMMMNYTKGLVEQFKFLILLSSISTLVPYLFCAASYIILGINKNYFTKKNFPSAVIVAMLAFAFSLWAIAGSGTDTVFWGFILLMASIPFYTIFYLQKNKRNN